jgi:hypothetical protein
VNFDVNRLRSLHFVADDCSRLIYGDEELLVHDVVGADVHACDRIWTVDHFPQKHSPVGLGGGSLWLKSNAITGKYLEWICPCFQPLLRISHQNSALSVNCDETLRCRCICA